VTVDSGSAKRGVPRHVDVIGEDRRTTGAPSPTDLAAILSVEPAEVSQVFFAGVGVPFCFAQLNSNEAVESATDQSGGLGGNARARVGSPRLLLRRKSAGWRQSLCSHVRTALGVEEDPATGSACAASSAPWHRARVWRDGPIAFPIQQGVSMVPPKRYRSGGA